MRPPSGRRPLACGVPACSDDAGALAIARARPASALAALCGFCQRSNETWRRLPHLAILATITYEYCEWARAAPRSEPGQVREEAAIRDR